MNGNAHRNVRASRGNDGRDSVGARKKNGEWAGPELCRKFCDFLRNFGGDERKHINGCNVNDQRVPLWPLLGCEDTLDRCRVESVGCKPVNGFRGYGDETATAQYVGGLRYCGMMLIDLIAPNWKKDGLHARNRSQPTSHSLGRTMPLCAWYLP